VKTTKHCKSSTIHSHNMNPATFDYH